MSKPRFQVYLEIDTLSHANTIKTNIQIQLVGKDIFEQHSFSVFSSDGKIIFYADWRFNSQTDRDSLKDWMREQVENHPVIKTWILKAEVSWHRCTHNDIEIRSCKLTDYFDWRKP